MILTLLLLFAPAAYAEPVFQLSLSQAEHAAFTRSFQLQSLRSATQAAHEHAASQSARLWPRLSIDGNYQYQTHVPTIALPPAFAASGISFGSHDSYAIGPTLSYTLWDANGVRDAYRGAEAQANSRAEDAKNGELQLLYGLRVAYVRLQLSLEELRLLKSSLDLSRAQNHDIETNFKAGAATRLDEVDSQREVLSYELQLQQKLADVGSDYRDLLALLQDPVAPAWEDVLGPDGEPRIQLDTLSQTLSAEDRGHFTEPDEKQPSLRSLHLQADAATSLADSQIAGLYPTVRVSASARWQYPDQVLLNSVEQNAFLISLSMPLFEMGQTRHLAGEARAQADSARLQEAQARTNLDRDFRKARLLVNSLHTQQRLAVDDVAHSEEAARLYYRSYRGGKINLTDVEAANNHALNSKVNSARIGAQILMQIFALQAISGEK